MSFKVKELKCLGFRPQTRIGECAGCKMICEECENLMIVEEEDPACFYIAKRFYRIETDDDEILKEYDSYELELRKDFKSFQKEYNCLYIVEISTNRDGDIIEIETIEYWEKPKRKKKRNVKLVVVEQNKCFECKKKITFRRRIDHFDFCLRCAPKHEKPIEYL
jgi:hypothetical protein